MANILEINNLTKKYGKKLALNDFSLEAESGKVIGILGPNGSGKTTLIKILTGLIHETSGSVLIDGEKPGAYTKSIISYLPDRNFLYKWMSVKDAINFYNDFFIDFNEKKAYELLEFMNLDKNMAIEDMSKGMKEKLNLSLVLSREAKLYILDEPIAGVDPIARDQILDAIINNYRKESTVLITTHLVKDMESIFDEVIFLSEGQILLSGNADDLRDERKMQIDDLYKDILS
ncbi:ABC transporter ATP-binding protein [Peptoniphilus stercorisuis]|uniref:ABC-2 type transport system ATP-binding protein n=1 Tax=Peptoniphilus stercorisuis TaxID=1436965 RepID=A0ABS4KG51_9FIRM|nr:ABC transporter ATP-binding protein [Peptoniphilus stercorisuis]MBP2025609.1 ABC-2 type transport system ATP-binding protein [Peptoniphilus stercorisuis]